MRKVEVRVQADLGKGEEKGTRKTVGKEGRKELPRVKT